MKVLITGSTGFIGQHIVEYLQSKGRYDISLLLREGYGLGAQLPEKIKKHRLNLHLVYADLRSFQLTSRAIREAQPHAVIHLAAAGTTDPFLPLETALRHNLNGTLNLIRACFEKGMSDTGRLIVARTPGELTHMNTYATSKLAAWNFCEMFAKNYNWPITGAMIYQCYGRGQSEKSLISAAIQKAQAQQDFPMTAGTQQKDWIHVSDVVSGIEAALTADQIPQAHTLHFGTGVATSVAEVVQKVYTLSASKGKPLIGKLPSRPGETAVQKAPLTETLPYLQNWQPLKDLDSGLQETMTAT